MCGDDHFSRQSPAIRCPKCGEFMYTADYPENEGTFECQNFDCDVQSITIELTSRKQR